MKDGVWLEVCGFAPRNERYGMSLGGLVIVYVERHDYDGAWSYEVDFKTNIASKGGFELRSQAEREAFKLVKGLVDKTVNNLSAWAGSLGVNEENEDE